MSEELLDFSQLPESSQLFNNKDYSANAILVVQLKKLYHETETKRICDQHEIGSPISAETTYAPGREYTYKVVDGAVIVTFGLHLAIGEVRRRNKKECYVLTVFINISSEDQRYDSNTV